MARTKRSQQDVSTRERIEEAFWHLLQETPYSQITIKALAWKAGVNHNMIYYYYQNMEDVARQAFDKILQRELPQILLSAVSTNSFSLSAIKGTNFFEQLEKAQLFAGSESPLLVSMFKDGIQGIWLEKIGKTDADLSELDRVELDFIFSGLTAVIGHIQPQSTIELFPKVIQDAIGKGTLETLIRIANE